MSSYSPKDGWEGKISQHAGVAMQPQTDLDNRMLDFKHNNTINLVDSENLPLNRTLEGTSKKRANEDIAGVHLKKRKHAADKPRVVCPFFRKDPTTHRKMSCRGTGFCEMGKLKDHLKDIHQISKETLQLLNFRSSEFTKLKTIEAKWKRVFCILFPDVADCDIPAPSVDTPVEHCADFNRLGEILKSMISARFHIPRLDVEFDTMFEQSLQQWKSGSPGDGSGSIASNQSIGLPTPETSPVLSLEEYIPSPESNSIFPRNNHWSTAHTSTVPEDGPSAIDVSETTSSSPGDTDSKQPTALQYPESAEIATDQVDLPLTSWEFDPHNLYNYNTNSNITLQDDAWFDSIFKFDEFLQMDPSLHGDAAFGPGHDLLPTVGDHGVSSNSNGYGLGMNDDVLTDFWAGFEAEFMKVES